MKTYRSLVEWLIARHRIDVLIEIVKESKSCKDFGPAWHQILILMDIVGGYLRTGMTSDPSAPFGTDENSKAFFDVWLFLDCPGLSDRIVVASLHRHSLWDDFFSNGGRADANKH